MSDSTRSLDLDVSFYDLSSFHPNLKLLSFLTAQPDDTFEANMIVGEFVELAMALQAPGPCQRRSDRQLIGSGGQFRVFKDDVFFSTRPSELVVAALKIPRFMLNAEQQLDISDPQVRHHIRSLIIEMMALCHPKLRDHPNIVKLIGWGFDDGSWHTPPFLALELASSDLQALLDNNTLESWEEELSIITQIGGGLDAIHNAGLLHGDLKPDNILIVVKRGMWVPRLTDFGGAVRLDGPPELSCLGTTGWRAPELRRYKEAGAPLDQSRLSAIDVWSFGVVVWAVLCHGGSPPRGSETDAAVGNALADLAKRKKSLSDGVYDLLRGIIPPLLDSHPPSRPRRVESLFLRGGHSNNSLVP